MSATEKNLKEAFAGESQANRKYLAFAKQADKEGFKQVAKLFRAAAEAETVHAHAHLAALKGIGLHRREPEGGRGRRDLRVQEHVPQDDRGGRLRGEQGRRALLPVRQRRGEGPRRACIPKALADPAGLKATEYYVCPVCGYTVEDHAPDKCPICQALGKGFYSVG